MIVKFLTFLRWLFASEALPTEVAVDDAPRSGFGRWMLKADTLDTAQSGGVAVARRQRFLQRIFAAEMLSSSRTERKETSKCSARFWSWLIFPEDLPHADGEPIPLDARTMFFRRLMAPESCPEERGVAIARREGFARRLLASEQCPSSPVRASGRKRGWLGRVLETEQCPVEPSPASLRRRGFLRNLLAPEEL